jgi:uncharacterized RDD family membrane protein YckC
VVDPFQLTNDIVADSLSLALPGLLWVLLYLVAWEKEPFAESIGFGRRVFWLLLPGALLATFGIFPIAPVSTDWISVSFAGAIFPLLVGLLAFGRAAPPRPRSLSRLLLLLAVEGGLLFALVLPVSSGLSHGVASSLGLSDYVGNELVVLACATVFSALVGLWALGSSDPVARPIAFLLALTSGVLVSTFVASSAIPGVGITEAYPIFLLPPIVAGFVAVEFADRVYPKAEGFAIPTAFLASTFGVLLGADLLRQPPLYGSGPSGLYTIGGAGVFDLVYLSGILAFGSAYLCHRAFGRGWTPVGTPLLAAEPSPVARLVRAFHLGVAGRLSESLEESAAASRAATGQVRRLLELAPAPDGRPWQDLPVPGWIVADQANLESSARAGTEDGREGFRAWRTARWFVLIARDLGARRFGTVWSRAAAFAIDLVLVTAPAAAVWAAQLLTMSGGLDDALSNVGFNAAIFGFIAWAFLYFVLAETYWGTTVGKRLLGLEVRDRTLTSPSGLSSLVRNTTVLPVLTVVGLGVAIALALGIKTGSSATLTLAGISIPSGLLALLGVLAFVLGGIAIFGGGAVMLIAATSERQRLGDLWAGTWVVRQGSPTVPSGAVTAARPGPEPPPNGSGAGPSG